MISRRSFLFGSSLVAASGLVLNSSAFGSIRNTTTDLSVSRTEVKIPSLPSVFEGFCIGMLADPHLGTCSNASLLSRAVDLLSNEKLDLLILAGDYVLSLDLFSSRFFYSRYSAAAKEASCSKNSPSFEDILSQGEHYFKQVALEASRLNPKYGIMAVLGNHDRWNSAENCCRIFEESGIEMLVNRSINITKADKHLEIYGSDDYSTGVPIAPQPLNSTRILVSHNPDFLSELAETNSFDLGLSGHTHGGQINLPLLGPLALNIQNPTLIQGLISLNRSQILVSRGIGTSGLPWRLNCPPEANLIILRS